MSCRKSVEKWASLQKQLRFGSQESPRVFPLKSPFLLIFQHPGVHPGLHRTASLCGAHPTLQDPPRPQLPSRAGRSHRCFGFLRLLPGRVTGGSDDPTAIDDAEFWMEFWDGVLDALNSCF